MPEPASRAPHGDGRAGSVRPLLARAAGLLLLAAACWPAGGCDLDGLRHGLDDFVLIIELDAIETVVLGQILDAETGELIGDEVRLTFEGPSRDAVIDLFSDPLTYQVVRGGLVSFGIRNTVAPSADDPVVFEVIAEADGYQPARATIRLTSSGENAFSVYLLDLAHPPAGVSGLRSDALPVDEDGRLRTPADLATPPEAVTKVGATLHLPAGTGAHDGSGNALQAPLRATFVYYTSPFWSALRFFPTSFVLPSAAGKYGTTSDVFVTAGFTYVALEGAAYRKASTTTAPLPLTVAFPRGTVDPLTGIPLQPGDRVGVFHLDDGAGTWTPAGDAPVVEGSNGFVKAAFEVRGLGWWSLGWRVPSCAQPSVIHVRRNGNPGALPAGVVTTGFYLPTSVPDGADALAPAPLPAGLYGLLGITGVSGQAEMHFDFCNGIYEIEMPPPAPGASGPVIDVHATVVPVCTDPTLGVRLKNIPTAAVFFRKASAPQGTPWRSAGAPTWFFDEQTHRLLRGEITLRQVEQGVEYTFATTYQGESHTRNFVVTGPQMTIEEPVGNAYCQ